MKAARYYGNRDIRIEEVAEPGVVPGAIKIKVAFCGICGSDLHEYLDGPIFCPSPGHPHPLAGEEPPVTLGHEMSGIVSEIGEGVSGYEIGESVVVEPYFVDGTCAQCREGLYHLCENMGFIGLSGGGGGLGEYIVVPERWVHRVGAVPLDQAALIEPLSVAYHAVERAGGVKAGDVAIVGGAGPIGLLVAAVLKGMGATVIVSELSAARKQKALDTGVADYALDPTQVDVPAEVKRLTGGVGAKFGFECTSVNVVLTMLFDAVKPRGVIVNVSIWGKPAMIDMQKLVLKEIDLRGTIAYVSNHARVIEMVQQGKIDLAPFITGKIALDDLVSIGFDTLINRNETAVKILVQH
jgi:(R,R)-butanediol dehydrogenase/meso-butanediol dehydrogenase/diacetyl reductase